MHANRLRADSQACSLPRRPSILDCYDYGAKPLNGIAKKRITDFLSHAALEAPGKPNYMRSSTSLKLLYMNCVNQWVFVRLLVNRFGASP